MGMLTSLSSDDKRYDGSSLFLGFRWSISFDFPNGL